MTEISGDAGSVAAAAANVAISKTVSAMLESATTLAATSSAASGMPEDLPALDDASSIVAAGVAETVSSMLESATTAAVAAKQEQEHQTASASAAATPFVPAFSPPGPTVEHTLSGIELSGRRDHGDKEDYQVDGMRRNDRDTANIAGRRQDSRGQLEPVVISDAGSLAYEAPVKDMNNRGAEESKAEIDENHDARQDTKDNVEGEDAEKDEELPQDGDDRAERSPRAADGNDHRADRSQGPASAVEGVFGHSGREERQQGGGRADGESDPAGEGPTSPNDRPLAATTAAPQIAPHRGGEIQQQQWQWWDNENPWSRDTRSSTPTGRKSTDRKPSYTASPPPAYQEPTPPPPYQEIVAGPLAPRSSTRKQMVDQEEGTRSSETPRSASAVSNESSVSSRDDTSRGPPPSYRAAVVGATGSLSSSTDREEKKQSYTERLPPPSHGRFYDDFRSAALASPLQAETNSSGGAQSDGGEWWAGGDQDHQHGTVWCGGDHGQERERGRQQSTFVSSGGPETTGDEHEEERPGGASWRRWRQHSEGRRRRTAATGSSNRPRTTMPPPRGKGGHKDTTLSGTESWDDDRWRLTRYLQACKRELAEAEERRRRAEAAANAAERNAWAAGNSKGADDDGEKRAWARAATQRVLDLMLVTERVRQEEQKRRVAAARASNQVARCKQPFRERRGRSQKGAFIGPSVPPADILEPPRSQQRMEAAAMRDIYWDEHGRRYSRRGSTGNGTNDQDSTSGEVGVALEIVRKVADACLEEGTDFGQPFREIDSDGDGRLTLAELGAALRRAGARLSLSQITALFRHFDEGLGLDTVGRGQFLWEFVDTKRLLGQWRKAGDVRGGRRARTAPFRSRTKKAGYGGGDDGTLSRHDVLHSLEELGIHVDGWEADALLDRFTVEDGSNNMDWMAFVSFMEAAENKNDGDNNNNSTPSNETQSAARARRERAGLRTSLPRHSQNQQRHWATSGPLPGGGLFEGEGNIAASSRPARSTETTTPKDGGKPYYHWASSAPSPAGGWRKENTVGNNIGPITRTRARTGSAGRRFSSEAVIEGSSPPPSLRSREPRSGGRARKRGLVNNVAEASRMLDGLLENQQELEAFLEEEIAKRERGEGGGSDGFARRQEVG